MSALLIFDYDGTVHDTMAIYRPAVLETAAELGKKYPELPAPVPDEARIRGWIGMRTEEMWLDFRPDLPACVRQKAGERVGRLMETLMETEGRWYSGAAESLEKLRAAGHTMIVLSSCTRAYALAHWTRFGMGRWFDAFLACDDYPEPGKGQVLKLLLNSPGYALARAAVCPDAERTGRAVGGRSSAVMLGDRGYDAAAAEENGISFIACAYGFSSVRELEGAAFTAQSPDELYELVNLALGPERG
ncbi:MAG: HAD hydrolase-like protein [Oscillospiraceae bacterium]|nr:HAD hydrolase-like protein [Oscillospiraceae bacterium]